MEMKRDGLQAKCISYPLSIMITMSYLRYLLLREVSSIDVAKFLKVSRRIRNSIGEESLSSLLFP